MKKILLYLVGIVLFLYIVLSIGIGTIMGGMLRINLPVFAFALVVISPISLALKGLKQQLLLSPFRERTPLLGNMKIWLVGFFFGTASPAKSGDAIRALYMKRNFSVSLGEGLAAVFAERALDVGFLFLFAFAGLFFLAITEEMSVTILFFLTVFFVVFAAALALLMKKEFTRFFLRPFFNMFAPEKFKESLKQGFNDFYSAFGAYRHSYGLALKTATLTIISWLAVFLQLYVLAAALSIEVSPILFIFALPIIILVEILPVSLSGLGTREAAAIIMLGLLGISAAVAVSFSLTILLFNLITAAVGFLLFNSMEKPI